MKHSDQTPVRIALCLAMATLLASRSIGVADEEEAAATPTRDQNKALAESRLAKLRTEHAGDASFLFRPGLYANHASREVFVFAETAAVSVHDPIEFFLIGESSGHDYEALAISFANPSDIDRALQFIGLKPGRPIDIDSFRMWPKGDQVALSMLLATDDSETREVGIEELLVDDRTKSTFQQGGFLFVGSRQVPDPSNPDQKVYAADVLEPNSIAANYNESTTVLDVPTQRSKGEQYRHISRNPELHLEAGRLVVLKLKPQHEHGQSRVRDLVLEVSPAAAADAGTSGVGGLALALHSTDGALASDAPTLPGLLAGLERIVAEGGMPYVQIRLNPALTLAQCKAACAAIAGLEGIEGIRVEPPPTGHAYYKAFLPREAYRTPADRPTQPWEIHLKHAAHAYTVEAVLTRTEYGEDIMNPTFERKSYSIDSPDAVAAQLGEVESKLDPDEILLPRVLIFYAPPTITYGDLSAIMAPLLKEYPIVYVFAE
ncbi:MAG: YdjY domain-containing protein [Verrucomicrobia bacterium]|nr:YdjY domain-containing protein [Verrucomicrobiota bacterium]MDA1087636.1 YdjY domain-containing protein [Verrucomicrobiota bacterium]